MDKHTKQIWSDETLIFVKDCIIKYKTTRDKRYAELVLANMDWYLLTLCKKIKKNTKHMSQISLQDLYHIAVHSLFQIMEKIKATEKPCLIPAWIKSYFFCNLKQFLRSYNVEFSNTLDFENDDRRFSVDKEEFFFDYDFFKDKKISKLEYHYLCEKILNGKSSSDLARELNITRQNANQFYARIMKKLRKIFYKDAFILGIVKKKKESE